MLRNILIVFLFLFSLSSFASVNGILDSTGIEKKGGKIYVVHKVEAKETLYSLSRRYGVTVEEIKKANEGESDLKIGQVVLIPTKLKASAVQETKHKVEAKETLYSISRKHNVSVEDLKKANPEAATGSLEVGQILTIPTKGVPAPVKETKETAVPKNIPKVHTVEAKETWYSISKKYGLTVEELKKYNPDIDELQTRDEINLTSKKVAAKREEKQEDKKEEKVVKNDIKESTTVIESNPVVATEEEKKPGKTNGRVEKVKPESNLPAISNLKKDGYTKVNESGFVEMYDPAVDFHYALHKNAPVGTIILVTNESTGQKVYVRVMGKLTDGGAGTIMKVSKKAYDKISKGDAKVKVTSSYIP